MLLLSIWSNVIFSFKTVFSFSNGTIFSFCAIILSFNSSKTANLSFNLGMNSFSFSNDAIFSILLLLSCCFSSMIFFKAEFVLCSISIVAISDGKVLLSFSSTKTLSFNSGMMSFSVCRAASVSFKPDITPFSDIFSSSINAILPFNSGIVSFSFRNDAIVSKLVLASFCFSSMSFFKDEFELCITSIVAISGGSVLLSFSNTETLSFNSGMMSFSVCRAASASFKPDITPFSDIFSSSMIAILPFNSGINSFSFCNEAVSSI